MSRAAGAAVDAQPPTSRAQAAQQSTSAAAMLSAKQKANYKHVPHSQKPPHLVAKRNARERRRVQNVNQAFYLLRKCVPIENRNKRVSKVKILQRSIEYIRRLQEILESSSSSPPPPPLPITTTTTASAPDSSSLSSAAPQSQQQQQRALQQQLSTQLNSSRDANSSSSSSSSLLSTSLSPASSSLAPLQLQQPSYGGVAPQLKPQLRNASNSSSQQQQQFVAAQHLHAQLANCHALHASYGAPPSPYGSQFHCPPPPPLPALDCNGGAATSCCYQPTGGAATSATAAAAYAPQLPQHTPLERHSPRLYHYHYSQQQAEYFGADSQQQQQQQPPPPPPQYAQHSPQLQSANAAQSQSPLVAAPPAAGSRTASLLLS